MNGIRSKLVVSLSVMLISALLTQLAVLACDDLAPSSSVGACYEGTDDHPITTCEGVDTDDPAICQGCGNQPPGVAACVYVYEDFPTDCVKSVGNNCNQPLQKCWSGATCILKNGKCVANRVQRRWNMAKKRTVKKCC